MARRRRTGCDISGLVIVDKPTGYSSNHVLQQVRRLFNANKAGHTGNLDPLATGVLPICLGEATKLSGYLLDADKSYHVRCQLGILTDTGDSEGQTLEQKAIPEFTAQQLKQVLESFLGEQWQVPPMFSALKHQGQPLYKLARKGVEVERKPRAVNIYSIELLEQQADSFELLVSCSKGTYIRTLVEDIAVALGTVGHVTMLRRTQAAGFSLADSLSLSALQQLAEQSKSALMARLVPAEAALPDWPECRLNQAQVTQLRFGQPVSLGTVSPCATVRLFDEQQQFFGLGQISDGGVLTSIRLFAESSTQENLVTEGQSR
ncbi:tRNA pseudouridine synthase B [Methylophaga lonarensis MPL]|uniref:tRNA pseudouridine synthase B n=1 Tax=Methylophaga lonarensis MPL TaxID=1286106 RepID=M7P0L5_9GAMM|nr:tRNA pseudouridine(55) synthase TruB [Methylophaga lonarensis]EMR13022.1 tRNA pseudouridine synthase B [Methylophaga lonarensis MPL]